jgi:predicted nuclease with TOPRIM domain
MRLFIQCVLLALAITWLTSTAQAQEQPKYEVLKKMYDDAIGSLKEAQNKKNELATKNEELAKQVAELQKQLDNTTKERDELQRQAATYAEKTFNLRSFYATWHEFMKRYPTLQAKWKVFLDAELLKSNNDAPSLAEPEWPFRVEG